MPSIAVRSATALLAAGTFASACGSGSDTTSSVDADPAEFCDQLTALEAASDGDVNEEDLASLSENPPTEIREDVVVLVGVLEQLVGLDEDDPAAFETAIELMFDPAVIEAGENLEAFGVSYCGLVASPLSDSNDSVDPDAASIEGLQKYLDETHADAPWRSQLSLFTDSGNGLGVGGLNIEPDAIAICEAVLDYASGFRPDVVVGVTNLEEEYSGEGVEVVTGSVAGGCDAVPSTPLAADDVVVSDSMVTDEAVTDEAVTEPAVGDVLTEAQAQELLAGVDRLSILQPLIDTGMNEEQAACVTFASLTNPELDDVAFAQLLVDCGVI